MTSGPDPAEHSAFVDTTIEVDIPSRVEFVALIRMIVAAAANSVKALQGERLDDLRWVTSEATTNAIEANVELTEGDISAAGRVRIICDVCPDKVRLVVSDQGAGLSVPTEVPDMTHPDRLLIEGAFGLPLIEQLSSEVDFASGDDGTTVKIEVQQRH